MMYQTCPTCRGTGRVNNRACPRCEGKGKIRGPLTSVKTIETRIKRLETFEARMKKQERFRKLLPMPPKQGPPLPRSLNIRWHKGV
jgi:DnaJ-class molecular chaperone